MDTATCQQQSSRPLEEGTYHTPRPSAESRFYAITVGKTPGVYRGTNDWHAEIDGVSGSAVRSFDTLEDAKQAYEEAMAAGMVYEVTVTGARRVLTEENVEAIPGMNAQKFDGDTLTRKWYSVYVGTQPGVYPGSHNISPLTSSVKGARSVRWGSYDQAYESFMTDLRLGHVIQDTTEIVRTRLG